MTTSTYQSADTSAAAAKSSSQADAKAGDASKAKVEKNEIVDPAKLHDDSWRAEVTQWFKKVEKTVAADSSMVVDAAHGLYDQAANSAPAKAVSSTVHDLYTGVTNSATVKAVESIHIPSIHDLYTGVTNSAAVKAVEKISLPTMHDLYAEVTGTAPAKAVQSISSSIHDLYTEVTNSAPVKAVESMSLSSLVDPFESLFTSPKKTVFDDTKYISNEQLEQQLQVQSIESKMTPAAIAEMRAGIDRAFNASYEGSGPVNAPLTAEAQSLESERESAVRSHKPGEKWFDHGKLYEVSAAGDLLVYTNENDIQWIGHDGSQYEKKDGVQIWRKGAREIKFEDDQHTKRYTYRAPDGSYKVIDGNAKTLVEQIGNLELKFTAKAELSIDLTRAFVMKQHDGLLAHGNAVGWLKTDAKGNRIALDSLYGVFIFTKDGKNYHLDKSGHLWDIDGNGVSHEVKDVPGILTRNADGTFQFGTIKIEKDGSFVDSERGLRMAGNAITWSAGGHTYKEAIEDGHWHEYIDGVMSADYSSKTGDLRLLENGKEALNYNFEKKEMHAFGITFSPKGTKIDGTDFSISNAGVVKFNDGTVWAGSASSSALATSATASEASSAVSDCLGEAGNIMGKASSEITEADVGLLVSLYQQLSAIGATMPDNSATADVVAKGLQTLGSKIETTYTRAIVNEERAQAVRN